MAAVHAGWKGAKAGVIEPCNEAMETLGARGSRIAAAIGPAISEAAYEVGPESRPRSLQAVRRMKRYFRKPGPVTFVHRTDTFGTC